MARPGSRYDRYNVEREGNHFQSHAFPTTVQHEESINSTEQSLVRQRLWWKRGEWQVEKKKSGGGGCWALVVGSMELSVESHCGELFN